MTLEFFLKNILPWIVAAIAFVIGYTKLGEQVESNKTDIKGIKDLLSSGDGGGAPFLTEPEHDRLQSTCQKQINDKIENIKSDIGQMKETMKEGDECRKESMENTANQFAALRKEFNSHYTDMAVLVATIKTDIKHLTNNERKKG